MGITFLNRSSRSLVIKNAYGDMISKTKRYNQSNELLEVIEEDHEEGLKDVSPDSANNTQKNSQIDSLIEEYELLMEIPFDSDRKRMSVIVKDNKTNKIQVLTKGADTNVLPICKINNVEKANVESILVLI